MITYLLFLLLQAPMPACTCYPPDPSLPGFQSPGCCSQPQNTGAPYTAPCTSPMNAEKVCSIIEMKVGTQIRWFMRTDFIDQYAFEHAEMCEGRITGRIRFASDGTGVSVLQGTLAPPAPENLPPNEPPPGYKPDSGLDGTDALLLYNRQMIVNFKAVGADGGGATIYWECPL